MSIRKRSGASFGGRGSDEVVLVILVAVGSIGGMNLEAQRCRNSGLAHLNSGRPVEAVREFEAALAIEPSNADLHYDLALSLLQSGQYERGWCEFEWRFKTAYYKRPLGAEWWDGRKTSGTLLVHCEQGLGDTFHFARYLKQCRERCGKVLFGCHRRMHAILGGVADELVASPPSDGVDFQIAMMSLPHVLELPSPEQSARPPYITASEGRLKKWRDKCRRLRGFKVGIAWSGNPANQFNSSRSIPLACFKRLNEITGVHLVSLQKLSGIDQMQNTGVALTKINHFDEDGNSFADTAAIMQSLELLIACDSAVAHLAGAMNVPTWLALSSNPDWRWTLHGESTPWYPSMRLFRQYKADDWNEVFNRIATELRNLV